MTTTKTFKSNQSQAVRLPKNVAFLAEVTNVEIVAIENTRIITPANQIWDSWFDAAPVSDDFMEDREQPTLRERESLDD